MAANSGELPAMLDAERANLDADASQVLADAGYRGEAVFEQLKEHPTELVVALGREGKQQVEIDASQYPCTTAMAAKLQTDEGCDAYRKRKWIAAAIDASIVAPRSDFVQQIASPPWMPDQVRHDKTFYRADS